MRGGAHANIPGLDIATQRQSQTLCVVSGSIRLIRRAARIIETGKPLSTSSVDDHASFRRRLRNRTPAPPPFSLMNSTPAASNGPADRQVVGDGHRRFFISQFSPPDGGDAHRRVERKFLRTPTDKRTGRPNLCAGQGAIVHLDFFCCL